MKSLAVFFFSLLHGVCAFQPRIQGSSRWTSRIFALSTADAARNNLLYVANRLQSDQGIFLYDKASKDELTKAVSTLEAVATAPTRDDYDMQFQGDWTLLVTTATNSGGLDVSKLPFFNEGPLKEIRATLNRSIKVQQRVRSTTDSSVVDRVDHIIEFQPPDILMEVLGVGLPDVLKFISVNPLEVSKAKVTLVHKATVQSVTPVLRTKIGLESVILTLAGTSQFLDPVGADVLGVNIPLGEFLNAGSFDTTYMDENLRVSRSKLGPVEQLRVFTRNRLRSNSIEAELFEVKSSTGSNDAPSDVESGESEADSTVNGMTSIEEGLKDTSDKGEETFP